MGFLLRIAEIMAGLLAALCTAGAMSGFLFMMHGWESIGHQPWSRNIDPLAFWAIILIFTSVVARYISVLALPVLVTVVIAEGIGWRSPQFYALAGYLMECTFALSR